MEKHLLHIQAVSLLYKFRDEGSSVIKMSYIDHTEADRGSGGYVRWNSYPYITSSFQHVKAYPYP